MAVGVSQSHADSVLAAYDTAYVQIHTGDPGSAGTTFALASTPRKACGLGTASTSGGNRQRVNSAIIRWDSGDAGATGSASHVSIWSAVTAGTFLRSMALVTTKTITAGEPFEIAAGSLVISVGALAS